MLDLSMLMEISKFSDDNNIAFDISVHHAKGNRLMQEDNYVCCSIMNGHLVAVLDGHGGSSTSEQVALKLPVIFKEEYLSIWQDIGSRHDLSDEHHKKIILNVFEKLDDLTRNDESGSTLSLVYIYPIGRDKDGKRVLKLIAASLGDSPVYLTDEVNDIERLMPMHSAVTCTEDITWINKYAEEAYKSKDPLHPFYGVEVNDGYIWIRAYSMDNTRGLSVTRALGDREFFTVLQKKPDVECFVVTSNARIILASDGILTAHEKDIGEYIKKLINFSENKGAHEMFKTLPNHDNVTCILIQMRKDDIDPNAPSEINERE